MHQGKAASELPSAQREQAMAHRDIRWSLHEDISDVQAEWRRFEKQADCTVFQSFTWLATWQSHIGERKGTRPVIVVGRDELGDTLIVLPLAVERHGLVRTLSWLGSDNNDYNGPLLAPHLDLAAQDFMALWQDILKRIQADGRWCFDLIEFVRMPATLGQKPNPFVSLPVGAHPDHAYLTHLAGDWESYYASKRSSATRSRDRTKRKRLGTLGPIEFVTPQTSEEIAQCVDHLIIQKTLSFARMGARNIFDRPGWADFYRALACDPASREFAHVSRLEVGSTGGAVNLGLVFQGTYYHLLASHAEGEVARFSPGAAHLQDLMRYAIARGCTVYDFTIGDEAYKRDWSDTQAVLFDHVAAVRMRGAPFAPVYRLQARLKRFVKQTPVVWGAFMRWRARFASLRGAAPGLAAYKEGA